MPEIVTEFPVWNESGIEPPGERKDVGWEPGDRIPAPWLNWIQYVTNNCIKELDSFTNDLNSDFRDLEDKMEVIDGGEF